jgi:hypothetical protein
LLAFRAAVAAAIPVAALLAYLAFGLYGLFLSRKLRSFRGRGEALTKESLWNAALYPPEAAKWIARDQAWNRYRIAVWLGLIVVANALYFLIKP